MEKLFPLSKTPIPPRWFGLRDMSRVWPRTNHPPPKKKGEKTCSGFGWMIRVIAHMQYGWYVDKHLQTKTCENLDYPKWFAWCFWWFGVWQKTARSAWSKVLVHILNLLCCQLLLVLLPLNLTKTTKVESLHCTKIDERKLPELRVWQHVAVAGLLASCFRHFAPIDF